MNKSCVQVFRGFLCLLSLMHSTILLKTGWCNQRSKQLQINENNVFKAVFQSLFHIDVKTLNVETFLMSVKVKKWWFFVLLINVFIILYFLLKKISEEPVDGLLSLSWSSGTYKISINFKTKLINTIGCKY